MDKIKTPHGYICHATHQDKPNWDGGARSRKLHLTLYDKKREKTLCNMLVESFEKAEEDGRLWSCLQFNGQCKSCLKVAGITEIEYEPLKEDIKILPEFYNK